DFKSLTKIKAVFESLNIQKESEIYFFYLLMETRPKLYENKEVARRALEPHKKNNSDVYAATEVFIRVFSEEMAPIPQKKYDLFFNSSFSAHLFCTLFKHFSADINGY
ncbi:TPA: transcriptional regulator, partial [Listeria monocytogenes]|nr:transcriptional regulator [Listeria monocytogenes]